MGETKLTGPVWWVTLLGPCVLGGEIYATRGSWVYALFVQWATIAACYLVVCFFRMIWPQAQL